MRANVRDIKPKTKADPVQEKINARNMDSPPITEFFDFLNALIKSRENKKPGSRIKK
ncbi:MAG: hypothetical protein NC828_03245 [Candidatus Omnitrophica bacterium]|nr:hypothetical protein [Candidatus Omnitrophota bacterium]